MGLRPFSPPPAMWGVKSETGWGSVFGTTAARTRSRPRSRRPGHSATRCLLKRFYREISTGVFLLREGDLMTAARSALRRRVGLTRVRRVRTVSNGALARSPGVFDAFASLAQAEDGREELWRQ